LLKGELGSVFDALHAGVPVQPAEAAPALGF
jgi:hypothetical protein